MEMRQRSLLYVPEESILGPLFKELQNNLQSSAISFSKHTYIHVFLDNEIALLCKC